MAWWKIHYFDRPSSQSDYNSDMLPFKFLPGLKKIDIKNGHEFETDQFEIKVANSDILVHMPSCSLWVDDQVFYVPDASRVLLCERNFKATDGKSWKWIHVGLLDDAGNGAKIKYNISTGETIISEIKDNIPVTTL